jgi:hypothetical protein
MFMETGEILLKMTENVLFLRRVKISPASLAPPLKLQRHAESFGGQWDL